MVYTNEELIKMDKDTLMKIIMQLQYEIATINTERMHKSKWASITPERVAKLHLSGLSLTEIAQLINIELADARVNDQISIQSTKYKIDKYEKATGQKIYKAGNKGRMTIH
jgi:hypothetical protein